MAKSGDNKLKKKLLILGILFLLLSAGVQSSFASISVLGGLTKRFDVKPGSIYRDVIGIRNEGEKSAEVRIYQTDYIYNARGENFYAESGTTPRSNGKWIQCSANRLAVAPGSTGQISFTVTTPQNLALNGSYWSMIMIEPVEDSGPAANRPGMGIKTQVRFGVQIIGNVGATGVKKIKFQNQKLIALNESRYAFQSDVENVGERELTPTMSVEIYDEKGALFGRFKGGRFRVFPTCSVCYAAEIGSIPKGTYNVVVILDNGDDFIVGDQLKIKV